MHTHTHTHTCTHTYTHTYTHTHTHINAHAWILNMHAHTHFCTLVSFWRHHLFVLSVCVRVCVCVCEYVCALQAAAQAHVTAQAEPHTHTHSHLCSHLFVLSLCVCVPCRLLRKPTSPRRLSHIAPWPLQGVAMLLGPLQSQEWCL